MKKMCKQRFVCLYDGDGDGDDGDAITGSLEAAS